MLLTPRGMNLVPPDVAPANSSDDDESIEEESDDVDENAEYDADADKESKRQQGLVVEAWPRTIVREEGKERQQQGLVVEAQPRILGLANYVANMSPTCRRHVSMSPNLGRHCVLLGNRRKTRMPNLYQLQRQVQISPNVQVP